MAKNLENIALEFQAFERLYADQLNRIVGKENEIIDYLNSIQGDGTDVSALILQIKQIKAEILEMHETDAQISGDVITMYETISGDMQTMYEELVQMIEDAKCKYDTGFTTNVACGALPVGSVIEDGEEVLSVVKRLLKAVLKATQGRDPSASISNFGGTYEVGTKVTPSMTITFSDGQFNSYENAPLDDMHTSVINAGCTPTYKFYKGSTLVQEGSSSTYTSPEITLPEGNTSFSGRVAYTASSVQPKNSDGKYNTEVKKNANSTGVGTAIKTYTAYYKWYFSQVTQKPSASDIRTAFNGSGHWNYTSTTTLNGQAMSTLMYCMALPNGWTMKKAMTSNNENILQQFLDSKETIQVNDAGGTARSYNLFTFKTAAQMVGVSINFEIGRG